MSKQIEKLVKIFNDELEAFKNEYGYSIGIIDYSGTWEEPYIYEPIKFNGTTLTIKSKSEYNNKIDKEVITKNNLDTDGIDTLRHLIKMLRKSKKEHMKNESIQIPNLKENYERFFNQKLIG